MAPAWQETVRQEGVRGGKGLGWGLRIQPGVRALHRAGSTAQERGHCPVPVLTMVSAVLQATLPYEEPGPQNTMRTQPLVTTFQSAGKAEAA